MAPVKKTNSSKSKSLSKKAAKHDSMRGTNNLSFRNESCEFWKKGRSEKPWPLELKELEAELLSKGSLSTKKSKRLAILQEKRKIVESELLDKKASR
jgi:hypothetical protein